MQRNVTATLDLGDKLSQAKDMQDALKLQSRVLPGPDACPDRSGQEHGRVRHEGGGWGLYPKELSHAVPRGARDRPTLVRHSAKRR